MSFAAAKAALVDIRNHVSAQTHPVEWDLSVALEQMCLELDERLSRIESTQREIVRTLQQMRI